MSTAPDQRNLQNELRRHRGAVRRQLARLRRSLRAHLAVDGLFWAVLAIVLLAAGTLGADLLLRLNLSTRFVLSLAAGASIAAVAVFRLLRPQLLRFDDLDLAAMVDRRSPGVGEKVANVLQLPTLVEGPPDASPSMVRAAVVQQAGELSGCELGETLNVPRRRLLALGILVLAGAVTVFSLAAPAMASLWLKRWLMGSDVRWPQRTYLSVVGLGEDDRLRGPRGEPFVLQINAQPKFAAADGAWRLTGRGKPLLVENPTEPTSEVPGQVTLRYRTSDGSTRQGNFVHYAGANFRFELPPLIEPVEFEVRGGDDWFGPLRVDPIDRPDVKSVVLEAIEPGGAAAVERKVGEGGSQLMFLPKTKVKLKLLATLPLATAEMAVKDQPTRRLVREGEAAFSASWEMKEALTIELRLTGKDSGLASRPYFLSIGLQTDREPRVTARATGVGRRVTPQARVPLVLRANDDFGLADLNVEMEVTVFRDQKPQSTVRPLEGEKFSPDAAGVYPLEVERSRTVALRDLELVPGTAIKLRAGATDRSVLGPRKGYSRWISFQVVTPEELFYEILMRQREQRARFAAALAMVKTQAEAIAALGSTDEATGLARTHQVVSRQVWQIANQLDATLQELTLNDLGSPQARDLLENSIIKTMRALHEEQMSQQRDKLDVLAAASPPTGPPRDEAKQLQDQIVRKMQTILSQMSQWESFVDVVNQLRSVIKAQDQVLDSTQKEQKSRTEDLFDK